MQIGKANINIPRTIQFIRNYASSTARKTGIKKLQEVYAQKNAALSLSPQKVGQYAARSRLSDQMAKSPQDRIFDIFG